MSITPFESDIAGEPEALRRFASGALPGELARIDLAGFDRIVLSGMGSSHCAAHPSWRRLVASGRPAWWLSTPHLLDRPELVAGATLLVLTSQSGRSGEIVSLLESVAPARARVIVAVTNEPDSPLAGAAHVVVELRSGDEATVSTKSYANSLAAHLRLAAALERGDDAGLVESIAAAADAVEALSPDLEEWATALLAERQPRLALVAGAARAPSALFGALIVKESSKLAAEGFVGGEFRHGPFELAGPGLGAVLFKSGASDSSLGRLAADLRATGSRLLEIGGATAGATAGAIAGATAGVPAGAIAGVPAGAAGAAGGAVPSDGRATTIATGARDLLGELVCDAKALQRLCIALAHANGVVPGAFRFGSKVTTTL